MLIDEAADGYDDDPAFKTLIDEVAGGASNVIVGSTYEAIKNPANGYIGGLTAKICAAIGTVTAAPSVEGWKLSALTTDADSSGGLSAGDTLTYTVTIKNTGNVTLTDVGVQDDVLRRADTGATVVSEFTETNFTTTTSPATLAPGTSLSYTATYLVTQDDIDAGGLSNTATVVGTPPSGPAVTDVTHNAADTDGTATNGSSPTTNLVAAAPEVNGVKTAVITNDISPTGISAGDTLTYTVTIKNTGNVTLTDVGVQDDVLRRADTDATVVSEFTETNFTTTTSPATLAPGTSLSYTAAYPVTQADIDAGGLSNTATVLGTPPSGPAVTDVTDNGNNNDGNTTNDATVTAVTAAPAVKITKTVDESNLANGVRSGRVLHYSITIENIGNVTLSQVFLTDTFTAADGTPLTLTSGPTLVTVPRLNATTLAVGEVWTYEASYTLGADAIDKGGVKNIAIVGAVAPNGTTQVSAESKVGGNTSADGSGAPTVTAFPGEISGSVKSYLAGASGVTVHLLQLVDGSYVPVQGVSGPITTVTDGDGTYAFLNLPPGTYGVEFDEPIDRNLSATSRTASAEENRITAITVEAGEVEVEQDAFFVDPSGVVYDTETFAPISGAKVTLYYNGAPVPDAWLNTTLGNANGTMTDSSGFYFYLFDPEVAQSGTYTLVIEKAGYEMSDTVLPAAGPYVPALGGGIEKIVPNDLPGEGLSQTYYLAFNYTFGANPAGSSNGVANNHIPMDWKLVDDVKQDVIDILKEDLKATMAQQGARMQGYAAGALDRLKSRDIDACKAELDAVLQAQQILFMPASAEIREENGAVLDQIADILKVCDGSRFEVAGHTDSNGSDADNMTLSQTRVDAVVAALKERGVDTSLLTGTGYGERRPIADNETASGRARNRRIEFVPAEPESAADGCVGSSKIDHDLSASAQEDGGEVSGYFSREQHDCATDSWRIVEGDLSFMRMASGIEQAMMNLSVREERFVTDDRVRGRFIGGYASRSTVTGSGEGTILGFGLNAGLYGADRLSAGLFFDYYLGAAAGRHTFDLDFDRTAGVINATGHYSYGALFAGAALSGETKLKNLGLTPRAGVDLAWSPGGSGNITAARGQLEDTSSLTVPEVMGLRAFVELGIEDLLASSPLELSVTPRLLCDWGLGGVSMGCGYGGSIELTSKVDEKGESFGIGLEGSHTGQTSSGSASLRYEWPIGNGKLQGGVNAATSGDASVETNFALSF